MGLSCGPDWSALESPPTGQNQNQLLAGVIETLKLGLWVAYLIVSYPIGFVGGVFGGLFLTRPITAILSRAFVLTSLRQVSPGGGK